MQRSCVLVLFSIILYMEYEIGGYGLDVRICRVDRISLDVKIRILLSSMK